MTGKGAEFREVEWLMVSSCELRFDDMSIAEQKAYVPDDFIYLFQESDRRVVRHAGVSDEDEEPDVGYFAPRAIILHRLDLAGYTAERARQSFQCWLDREREKYVGYAGAGGGWAHAMGDELKDFSYDEWKRRVKDVLLTRYDSSRPGDVYVDEIDRRMRDQEWLFFGDDVLVNIRAILEALPDVREVSLDIGPLIGGGWIEPDERICEKRRAPGAQWRSVLQPTVIIAEGSTDILVLKRSLRSLYPYLTDYITFFDYEGSSSDGGASYIVKFLRAFAAARINTSILAIFDNDAVGLEAVNATISLSLPDHIKVTRLPDIELARSYPTLGPQGRHPVDVNGKAVGIELFLGRHNHDGRRNLDSDCLEHLR
jgi:HEPN superfamily Toprim-like protein